MISLAQLAEILVAASVGGALTWLNLQEAEVWRLMYKTSDHRIFCWGEYDDREGEEAIEQARQCRAKFNAVWWEYKRARADVDN